MAEERELPLHVGDEEEDYDYDAQQLGIEDANTLDTTVKAQVELWVKKVREVGPNEGPDFRALLQQLPTSRDACGRGISTNRVLKGLKTIKNLSPTEYNKIKDKKSAAKFTKAQMTTFHELIDQCFELIDESGSGGEILKKGLLIPFVEGAGGGAGGGGGGGHRPDSEVNRVLLMALTLTDPAAVPILEKLHATVSAEDRPAALDVPGGIVGNKMTCYEQLRELSETLKANNEFDLSRFSKEHTGSDEAAETLIDLSPLHATIPSAVDFKTMHVKWMNAVDTLICSLDASGGNVAGVARRQTCFNTFIGQAGRSKNISLFVVFLIFEGADKRFTSRGLPVGKGVGSSSGVETSSSTSGSKSKKQQQMMNLTIAREPVDSEEAQASKKLKSAQELLIKERTNSEKATRLQAAVTNPEVYNTFDETQKKALSDAFFSSLLGGN